MRDQSQIGHLFKTDHNTDESISETLNNRLNFWDRILLLYSAVCFRTENPLHD